MVLIQFYIFNEKKIFLLLPESVLMCVVHKSPHFCRKISVTEVDNPQRLVALGKKA